VEKQTDRHKNCAEHPTDVTAVRVGHWGRQLWVIGACPPFLTYNNLVFFSILGTYTKSESDYNYVDNRFL